MVTRPTILALLLYLFLEFLELLRELHESVRVGGIIHVGILGAGFGEGLALSPLDEFSVLVVLLTVVSIVVGVRAAVLLATVAVQLALPRLGGGGAALLRDAVPVHQRSSNVQFRTSMYGNRSLMSHRLTSTYDVTPDV